jgi:hypothetical protein
MVSSFNVSAWYSSIYVKGLQIKAECNQLLEMAAAFGVRLLGAALAILFPSTDFGEKGCGALSLQSMPQY